MLAKEKRKLREIVNDLKLKEDNAFSQMRFLSQHKFEFEHAAMKLEHEAYRDARLKIELFLDEIEKEENDV